MYQKLHNTRMKYLFHPLPEDGFITPARWRRLSLPAGCLIWQRYLKTREPFAYYLKLRWPHAFQRYLALHRRAHRKHPVLVNKHLQRLFETLRARNTPLNPSGNAGVSPAQKPEAPAPGCDTHSTQTPNQCTIIPFPHAVLQKIHQPEKKLFPQNEPNFRFFKTAVSPYLLKTQVSSRKPSAAKTKPNANPNKPDHIRIRSPNPPNPRYRLGQG